MSICKNLLVAVPNLAIVAIVAIMAQDKVAQDIGAKAACDGAKTEPLGLA